MRYLLTGACGFIGSNISLNLLKNGHHVMNIDKLTYAANISGFENFDKYTLIKTDICDLHKEEVLNTIKEFQPEYIIHLAAESMVDRSLTNNKAFFDSNVLGTWNVLELLRVLPLKKAIFFSTDEVYGSLDLENFKTNNFRYGFNVKDALGPRNPYAGSKAAADQVTLSYIHSFDLPICIVRPTNNFGPRQAHEKFIPVIIRSILQNKKIPVYGTGNFFREWLYIDDTCKAIELLLDKGVNGSIYNIGSGIRFSNIEIIERICKLMNTTSEKVVEFIMDPRGKAHDQAYAVNSTEMRQFGWKPENTIDSDLMTTIDYYKATLRPNHVKNI